MSNSPKEQLARLEKALMSLRRLEGKKISRPCPDGREGCLVFHYQIEPGPIEISIRESLEPLLSKKSWFTLFQNFFHKPSSGEKLITAAKQARTLAQEGSDVER